MTNLRQPPRALSKSPGPVYIAIPPQSPAAGRSRASEHADHCGDWHASGCVTIHSIHLSRSSPAALRARLADFGNRLIDKENIAELFTVGVKGDKLFNGSWGYDGAFRYSQIENISEIRNVSVSRFNRILNAADSIFNPTAPDFIGTTIPYNPFGDYRGADPIQPTIDRLRDVTCEGPQYIQTSDTGLKYLHDRPV